MKNNECCLNDRGIQVFTTYCRMMIFEFMQALFVPQQASVAIHTLKSFRVSNKTRDTTNPEATSICATRRFGFCPEEPVSLKRCAKTGNGLWGACSADVSQRCYPVSNNRHIYSTIIQRPCTQWINFQLLWIPTHALPGLLFLSVPSLMTTLTLTLIPQSILSLSLVTLTQNFRWRRIN